MNREIIRHDAAKNDLIEYAESISRTSPQNARRFLSKMEETLNRLLIMPEMGSPCEFRNPVAAGMRFFTLQGFRNFVIIYRPIEAGIEVIRVIRASRGWQALFEA